MKRIDRFDPVLTRGFDEAERHYVDIHHRFARNMYRRDDSRVHSYIANRAVRQYDINGTFDQTPDAWRFVIEEVDDGLEEANSFLPEWARDIIWQDHLKCIRNIQAFDVESRTVLDQTTTQLHAVKYLFEFDAPDGTSPEALDEYYDGYHASTIAELLASAFGFRRFITNRVLRQGAVEGFEEDGQIIASDYLPETRRYRYEEYWFDNTAWAEEFFFQDAVQDLMRSSHFGRMAGYQVDVRVGVDKL